MSEKYFEQALSDFTSDVAYVRAVRHLYDNGLTVAQIQSECLYPLSEAKIRQVIDDYEKEKAAEKDKPKFVYETGPYGTKSFRMIKEEEC